MILLPARTPSASPRPSPRHGAYHIDHGGAGAGRRPRRIPGNIPQRLLRICAEPSGRCGATGNTFRKLHGVGEIAVSLRDIPAVSAVEGCGCGLLQ